MKPLVSIVVPVYNAEKYLHQCIESILNQSYKHIELICVDDGSTDTSADIIKIYTENDKRVTLFSQENSYAGVARNNGMKLATGKYIMFLDADDYFDTKLIETMCEKAEKSNLDITVCDSRIYDEQHGFMREAKTNKKQLMHSKDFFSPEDISDNIFQMTAGWDKLYRLDFVRQNDITFQNTRVANDERFVDVAYALAKRIGYVDQILITHRGNVKGSLEYTRHNSWQCAIEMLRGLKTQLVQRNLYDRYKRSFCNRAGEYLIWYADTFNDLNSLKDFLAFIKDEVIDDFDLIGHDVSYFYEEYYYSQIENISRNYFEAYLCEQIRHQRAVMEKLRNGFYIYENHIRVLEEIVQGQKSHIEDLNIGKRWTMPQGIPKGTKIIVYGFGDVGKDYCAEIIRYNEYKLIMAVDRDYQKYSDAFVKVGSVEDISQVEFDYILISILKEEIAMSVKDELVNSGISENKILWFEKLKKAD